MFRSLYKATRHHTHPDNVSSLPRYKSPNRKSYLTGDVWQHFSFAPFLHQSNPPILLKTPFY